MNERTKIHMSPASITDDDLTAAIIFLYSTEEGLRRGDLALLAAHRETKIGQQVAKETTGRQFPGRHFVAACLEPTTLGTLFRAAKQDAAARDAEARPPSGEFVVVTVVPGKISVRTTPPPPVKVQQQWAAVLKERFGLTIPFAGATPPPRSKIH